MPLSAFLIFNQSQNNFSYSRHFARASVIKPE